MTAAGFLIRPAAPGDLEGLFALARLLDSYNLPADRPFLKKLIADSAASFAGRRKNPARARYLFLLEDLADRTVAGCSLIIAKHGTPGLPHLFLDSGVERRVSRTLGRAVEHKVLRLGATEDGPTEVGGLVLLPRYRGRPEKLGRWLSHARFLYIAAHRDRFQPRLLAEFLPAFTKSGDSPFWEYFGKKFTRLSYHEADRLSITNKEFVLSLFPRGTIYQDFFPDRIVRALGQAGSGSLPAARMLEQIGFHYLHQIEPFDGGPYYGARTRDVLPVRQARPLVYDPALAGANGRPCLLLAEKSSRTLVADAVSRNGRIGLPEPSARALAARPGDRLWTVPFQ